MLRLAPFTPSEDRIRDGGPPLHQEWTKWVVGPGRAGRARRHHLRRLGPAPPGGDAGDPARGDAPRRRTGRVRPPAPRRQRPAQLRGRRARGAARRGALMLPILPRMDRGRPRAARAPRGRDRPGSQGPHRAREDHAASAASASPTSAPGSGTTRCCSRGARVEPTASSRTLRCWPRRAVAWSTRTSRTSGSWRERRPRCRCATAPSTSSSPASSTRTTPRCGAVAEAQRVLRPGGRLIVIGHYGRDDVAALLEPEVVDHVMEATQRRTGWWLRHGFKIKVVHARLDLGDCGHGPRAASAPLRRPRTRVPDGRPSAIAPPEPRPVPPGYLTEGSRSCPIRGDSGPSPPNRCANTLADAERDGYHARVRRPGSSPPGAWPSACASAVAGASVPVRTCGA